jgi:protein-disulfide isomerase
MKKGQVSDDTASLEHAVRWPWWLALCFCLAGLGLSILLEQIHFKTHTDPAFHSFCAVDRKVNCDIVARSPYAVLLGVPVAAWGIFGYLLAVGVSLWGARSRRPLLVTGCGLYLTIAFAATSAALGAVSAFLVTAVCLLCLGTYAVNLLLVVCMLLAAREVGVRAAFAEPLRFARARPLQAVIVPVLLAGGALGVIAGHPSYWNKQPEANRTRPTTPTLPFGVEPGGGHFIGATNPAVTLIEFSDYECPFCRQAHTQLRALVETYPTQFRMVHRHYPLDKSCNSSIKSRMHENACFAAMIAECAGRQNRFWQANDYLFAEARMLHSRPNGEIAHDIGLDAAALDACLREEGPRSVALDVDEGNRLNIQGTPTFLIEGKTYMGAWPAWLLTRLQNAATHIDGGTNGAR